MPKIAGSGSSSGSGLICQRHGSADPTLKCHGSGTCSLQERRREAASRANELVAKRETLKRLTDGAAVDIHVELGRAADELEECSRRGAAQAVRMADLVERLGRTENAGGLAQLHCRVVQSENIEKKEKLDELERLVTIK
jgi:hypothetical protein